jgi:hypothetical protein
MFKPWVLYNTVLVSSDVSIGFLTGKLSHILPLSKRMSVSPHSKNLYKFLVSSCQKINNKLWNVMSTLSSHFLI